MIEVTLVIPVKDEAQYLPGLMASIREQTYPPKEIIVVDAGSWDQSKELLLKEQQDGVPLRIIECIGALPGKARNEGIKAASSAYVALTDGGVRLDGRWLENLVRAAESQPSAAVFFGTYLPVVASTFARIAAMTFVSPAIDIDAGKWRGPSVASVLLKRACWEAIGGFPEDLRAAEDLIFIGKLEKHCGPAIRVPEAIVHWHSPATSGALFSRFQTFSFHTLKAGLGRKWHLGASRYYIALAVCGLAAYIGSPYWALPGLLVFASRIVRAYWFKRELSRGILFVPGELLAVLGLTLLIDLAMFVGMIQWILRRCPKSSYRAALHETFVSRWQ